MRIENWEHKLNEYIECHQLNEFKYGKWDCCIFTAGAVREITGENHMKEFKYKSKKVAEKLIEAKGGLIKILNEKFEQINPYTANRGDIIYYKEAIGICIGTKAVFVNLDGYSYVPMNQWEYAWRV